MSDNETTQILTMEDRLKAIAYQFIALYERWSEDRQVAAKQGADTAELVKLFTEQVKNFKTLEPAVREQIRVSIHTAAISIATTIGEEVHKEATHATKQITQQLANATAQAEQTLAVYKNEVVSTQWKVILGSIVTTALTCLLLVWFAIPKPMLPLTNEQLITYQDGLTMAKFWDKLSKEEQKKLLDIADGLQQDADAQDSTADNATR